MRGPSFWGGRASLPGGAWAGDAGGWASATETCFRAEAVLGRLSVSPGHPSLEFLAAGVTARGGRDVRGRFCKASTPPRRPRLSPGVLEVLVAVSAGPEGQDCQPWTGACPWGTAHPDFLRVTFLSFLLRGRGLASLRPRVDRAPGPSVPCE